MSTTTETPAAQVSLNVLAIGASRNIGYYSSLKLLQHGATVTFLLRNPTTFDNDTEIQKFVSSGHARLVKGDALVKDDVARVWAAAIDRNDQRRIDYLLFTLGGTPKFSPTKGFVVSPPNLVTQSLLNTLSTLPLSQLPFPPKILTISSTGLTPTSHASLPPLLKPMYGYLLASPHADKVGAEQVMHHVTANWTWNTQADSEAEAGILPEGWEKTEGLPAESSLQHVIVIRPSLLTDGKSLGEKYDTLREEGKEKEIQKMRKKGQPYRVSTGTQELGGYTVARKDVAHFIVELFLNRWNEYDNKVVHISY
ncbi:hypothetical protein AN958_05803 [Leucoagaricus sp. SymC.cos]|nr:hypothetical protein AN958_05803 [Leucoagaricus sp. SymC.cos]